MTTEFQPNIFAYGDIAGNGAWLVGHYRQHLRYNAALAALSPAVVLPVFDILNIDGSDGGRKDWLNAHENWHELLRPQANITGIDLSAVDLTDQGQFYQWLDLHNFEHGLLDAAFGVG